MENPFQNGFEERSLRWLKVAFVNATLAVVCESRTAVSVKYYRSIKERVILNLEENEMLDFESLLHQKSSEQTMTSKTSLVFVRGKHAAVTSVNTTCVGTGHSTVRVQSEAAFYRQGLLGTRNQEQARSRTTVAGLI